MLQKFKITTCAFILCLFGLTMTDVTNVYARAGDSAEILECANMKSKSRNEMTQKKNCFAQLARDLTANQQGKTETNPPGEIANDKLWECVNDMRYEYNPMYDALRCINEVYRTRCGENCRQRGGIPEGVR
jgi:hypothetical protein